MSPSKLLTGLAIATMTLLSACNSGPPAKSAADIDDQYGIPPSSIPPDLLKPNGEMNNGLLPAQPYDSGG
jgi:hypothetical protein